MFENIRSGYARLIPSGTNDQEDAEILADLGIYEDEESRSERDGGGNASTSTTDLSRYCPASILDFYDRLPTLALRERVTHRRNLKTTPGSMYSNQ